MTFFEIFDAQEALREAEARIKEIPFVTTYQVEVGRKLLAAGFQEAGVQKDNKRRISTLSFTHPELPRDVEVYGGPNEWESRLEYHLGAVQLWWLTKATPEELFQVVKRLADLDPANIMARDK